MARRLLVWTVMAVAAAAVMACGDGDGDGHGDGGGGREDAKRSSIRVLFERGVEKAGDEFGLTAGEVACAKRRLRSTVSDAQIAALPLGEDGQRMTSPAIRLATARAVGACEEGPGPKITSIDRYNFEAGLRNGLGRNPATKDLPESTLDCVMRRLRRTVDDRRMDAIDQSTSSDEEFGLRIQPQVAAAIQACS